MSDDTTTPEETTPDFLTLHGQQFQMADQPNGYLMTKFGMMAAEGADTDDPEAARLMMKLLKSCFTPEEFKRFDRLCEDTPTSAEDLLTVVTDAIEVWSARPTPRPADSSDGPPTTSPRSTDDFSSRVIQREIERGRPDLAYAAWEAQQAQLRAAQRAG